MSIVLQGSTSGSVTLQEPAVAGTTVLTLPAVSGTILTTTSPKAGNVIQVVNSTFTNAISTTSATLVTTGYSVSITPTSSSNKILIYFSFCGGNNSNAGSGIRLGIYRGATNLTGTTGYLAYSQQSGINSYYTVHWLDSPATTSSTTYTMYYGASNSTAFMQTNGSADFPAAITLMEIAA